ncbi:AT-rich interactive domain-containing protein 3 isoform X2 [Rosa chinensis]|uniref:AT-rich interactive domain-containing protein 3 isoform X2 n=1 Tax=Rosa chinensis TaxID=74649 RepID=UPI001AD94908|nr:AT-rich interactive domain-containing protein 3 isoform X2 [Rosa chinensis]
MQGWHSQCLFGNGEEKHLSTMPKSDKQLKSSGLLKRKKLSPGDCAAQITDMKVTKPRLDMTVFDIGPPADWVKINVKRFSDCFEWQRRSELFYTQKDVDVVRSEWAKFVMKYHIA